MSVVESHRGILPLLPPAVVTGVFPVAGDCVAVAVAAEKDANPTIAVTRVLSRELRHPRRRRRVLRQLPRFVAESRSCRPE